MNSFSKILLIMAIAFQYQNVSAAAKEPSEEPTQEAQYGYVKIFLRVMPKGVTFENFETCRDSNCKKCKDNESGWYKVEVQSNNTFSLSAIIDLFSKDYFVERISYFDTTYYIKGTRDWTNLFPNVKKGNTVYVSVYKQ